MQTQFFFLLSFDAFQPSVFVGRAENMVLRFFFLGTKSAINLSLTIWSHLWNIIWKHLWIKCEWERKELRSSQNSCRRTSVTVMIRESVEENWSVELKCNIALTHAIAVEVRWVEGNVSITWRDLNGKKIIKKFWFQNFLGYFDIF